MRAVTLTIGSFVLAACGGGGGDAPAVANAPPNSPPSFSQSLATSVLEGTVEVGSYTASDANNDSINYSVSGTDVALFSLTSDAELTFGSAPDFENPGDADGDNVYEVTISASDGVAESTLALEVTVDDAIDGRVLDAPISGARVFIDLDSDGQEGTGEPSTTTDNLGFFFFLVPEGVCQTMGCLSVWSVGGTDTQTDADLGTTSLTGLGSGAGPFVISPLNTVLTQTTTPEDALTALGIMESVDAVAAADYWQDIEGSGVVSGLAVLNAKIGLLLQTASTTFGASSDAQAISVASATAANIALSALVDGLDVFSKVNVQAILTTSAQEVSDTPEDFDAAIGILAPTLATILTALGSDDVDLVGTTGTEIIAKAQIDLQGSIRRFVAGEITELEFEQESNPEALYGGELLTDLPDLDSDGTADLFDSDIDGDDVSNDDDAFPRDETESIDTDGDGTGNNADTDDDNDGVLDEEDPHPLLAPPIASAGSDQSVEEESVVILNGSASFDRDGSIVSYQWSQTSGDAVLINDDTSAQANFTAPSLTTTAAAFGFKLVVTDNDGFSAEDIVTITARPRMFDLTGTITAEPGSAVDGDVNDPLAAYAINDFDFSAQALPNPVTLSGYVNVAGTGPEGRSSVIGDENDWYWVNLRAGQTITLNVSDTTTADIDLYLYDSSIVLLDASLSTGAVESVVVPADAEYYIRAYAFSGWSNYVLVIDQPQVAGASNGFRLSDDFVPGELILRYEDAAVSAASVSTTSSSLAANGMQIAAGDPSRSMLVKMHGRAPGLLGIQSSGFGGSASFADDEQRLKYETLMAIKRLNGMPSVKYAQPNYRIEAFATVNDPLYPLQWHYTQIALEAAWDITTGDPNVIVAVIDTGVLLNHPDLQGQLVPGFDFIRDSDAANDGDGIDADPNDPGDSIDFGPSSFHGTHVAGTIAADTDNAVGVAGVAPSVKIMPIRVLGVGGGSLFDVLEGIKFAAGLQNVSAATPAQAADVLNLSLGGTGPCSPAEQDVFTEVRQAGITVVVAAGNDAVDVSLFTPGNCDDVIAVSAVDIQKNLAPYSNHGARIDVAAPGGDTRTDLNGDGYPDGVLSTLGDDTTAPVQFEYGFYAGTSMAAPHVAGVVALMKSVNPALTPAQIDQMFIDGELTDDIGDPNSFGNGLINARKAVFAALNAAGTPPVDNPTLAVNPTSLNFGATSNIGSFTLSNTSGGGLQANAPSFSAGWLTVTPASVTDDNLGTYTVTVNRSGLADGWYGDTISISSDANTVEVTALMEVRSVQILPNAGYVYALLLDSETFVTLAVDVVSASGGNYLYAFTDVPDGFYYLVAGSDNDNDFFICDPGESCGTYPTTSLLEIIILDRDLSGRDFPIGYNVLVSGASTESEVDVSPSYRRMTKALKKLRIRQ